MAISLLQQASKAPTTTAFNGYNAPGLFQQVKSGTISPTPTQTFGSGTSANTSTFGNPSQPMGVTAKTPAANTTPPATTIPKAQANPVVSAPVPTGGFNQNAQGLTPEQMLAQDPSRADPTAVAQPAQNGLAAQAGSLTGTQSTTPPAAPQGTLGTGSPTAIAANQTASGLLGNMVGQSQGLYQNQAAMINPQIQQNLQNVTDATQREMQLTGGSYSGSAADYAGRIAQLENLKQAAQGNINAASNNLGTFSGQAQNALGTGLSAATQQVAAPYNTPLVNPLTGQFTNSATSGTGGAALQNAVAQTVQLMKNGASQADAMSTTGLSNFGLAGQAALTSALGSGYNPTAQAGIAAQNTTQGQTYQGIAQDLSNALQTMQPIGQKLVDFITTTGQNPATSPLVNEQIGKINAQLYPAQVATLNAAINDIRSFAIQILGSQSGANPTDVTNAVNSFDFSKFSATDLQSFLNDLNNLGNTRLSQTQSAMKAGYGSNPITTPAAGITASDQGSFSTGVMSPSSMASNLGKALVGSLASVGGAAVNEATTQGGALLGGAAIEKVFGAL